MRINNEVIINIPTALTADWQSRAINLAHIAQYSLQAVFTGVFSGSFSLQVSNDSGHSTNAEIATTVRDIVSWTDIDSSIVQVTEAGDITWEDDNVGYLWVRIKYVHASGTGSLNKLTSNIKGI